MNLNPITVVPGGEANMTECLRHGFPYLRKREGFRQAAMSVVCYGPSLKDTWREIPRPILTCSGAHDFLISRGVIPDYHVDCDPREHKTKFLQTPHKGVKYLMASCCHPKVWDYLKGRKVTIWHCHNGMQTDLWLAQNDPENPPIGGGTTAGLRALEVAAWMGFRRFHLFGMDSSFSESDWAGVHYGQKQDKIRATFKGRSFVTSNLMLSQVKELQKILSKYDLEVTLHGDGLMQHVINGLRRAA